MGLWRRILLQFCLFQCYPFWLKKGGTEFVVEMGMEGDKYRVRREREEAKWGNGEE